MSDSDSFTVSTQQAAEILGVAKQTLFRWRQADKGPPHFQVGRTVRYPREDLLVWARVQGRAKR